MDRIKIEQGGWVVVCDGRKALILENAGDQVFPNLRMREVHEHKDTKTSDQGTDAPGRSVNSVGSARSAMEQTDWHDEAEKEFLQDLAERLDAALGAGDAKSVIIVAPPRALGVLRAAYSPVLRDAVREEIDKDYVRLPIHQIEEYLVGKVVAL